eukprot:gene14193-10140_t
MEITPKKSLYLRGLQAAHSGVLEIVDTVFHIAMYRFCKVRSSWERMEVEGSAYVTRNGTAPFHSFIVLNKKADGDFILHIETIEKVHIQDQYIMMRCDDGHGKKYILGIWIHDLADRNRLLGSILRVKDSHKNRVDVVSLLGKFVGATPSRTVASAAPPAAVPAPANENKSSALLSFLKANTNTKEETIERQTSRPAAPIVQSSGNATLDDIVKKPETVKNSRPADASSKLLSLLYSGASSASLDFPTDCQISAKAKMRIESSAAEVPNKSPSVGLKPTPVSTEDTVAALKLVLSVGSSASSSPPSRGSSNGLSFDSSDFSPLSKEIPIASRHSSSPVTVAVSSLQESSLVFPVAIKLFKDVEQSSTLVQPVLSASVKKSPKLISPSDLGIF